MTDWLRFEKPLAFLFFSLFFLGVSYWSGGLLSGDQMTEDYEVHEIAEDLKTQNVFQVIRRYTQDDHMRLRIYYAHRVLQIACFGPDITAMRIEFGLLGALAAFFLFRLGRHLDWGLIPSVLFALLTLAGGGWFYIWWRPGTAENLGMPCLAAALSLVTCRKAVSSVPKFLREFLFTVLVILMSFAKESFIVIVPSILFLRAWLETEQNGGSLLQAARTHTVSNLILLSVMLAQIVFILKVTGSVVGGYVGYEGFEPRHAWEALRDLIAPQRLPVLMSAAILFVLARAVAQQRLITLRTLLRAGIFVCLMTIPLVLLFQKSGMKGHYSLPGGFGLTFVSFYLLHRLRPLLPTLLRSAVLSVLCIPLLLGAGPTLAMGAQFREEGGMVKALVEAARSGPQDLTVICLDPARNFEWSYAAEIYLEKVGGADRSYLLPIMRPRYSAFEKYLLFEAPRSPIKRYRGRMFTNIPDPSQIRRVVVLPGNELWFRLISRKWFSENAFEKTRSGPLVIYSKRTEG